MAYNKLNASISAIQATVNETGFQLIIAHVQLSQIFHRKDRVRIQIQDSQDENEGGSLDISPSRS